MTTDPSLQDDALWRDGDRFPLGAPGGEFELSFAAASEVGVRPFAMQEVRYSQPGESFPRPAVVVVCPARQIGLVAGRPLREVYSAAPSMTKYDTDGQDVLVVDYAEDD
ncbi:MAG: hypothetical protein H0V92_03120 [Pseudonocardiales bacterium]|nr:hypothetical protein [Pseudonocardiales bacterium]